MNPISLNEGKENLDKALRLDNIINDILRV